MLRSFFSNLVLSICCVCFCVAAQAQTFTGSYLSGRQAALDRDYTAAAQYFPQALASDPNNADLQRNAMIAFIGLGRVDDALSIAKLLTVQTPDDPVVQMVQLVGLVKAGAYKEALDQIESQDGFALTNDFSRGWLLAALGENDRALAAFNRVSEDPALRGLAIYHQGLSLAWMGDLEAAEALFDASPLSPLNTTRRGVMARVEILSQLGRNEDALSWLNEVFGASSDPELDAIRARLEADETLSFTAIMWPSDGVAEVYYTLADALQSEIRSDSALLFARAATYLRPDHVDAQLLSADLLTYIEQYQLAEAAYAEVDEGDPSYHIAVMGQAELLRQDGRAEDGIAVLRALTQRYPNLATVYAQLANALRFEERFSEAAEVYDRAIALTDEGANGLWFLYYSRAISFERVGDWPKAEADFRKALELNPGEANVLNYLGYSLVEKRLKLDEALEMIQQAEASRPDRGHIVDSLGWVLYRLGRYEEAVEPMERAVALMPIDPVVNDHLGDVYWAVGRKREARFQWSRALSFVDPDDRQSEADPDRMRRKLEVGLDLVLQEEGAPPLGAVSSQGASQN